MKPQKAKHLYLEMEKKNPSCLNDDYMVFEKHDGWYGYQDYGQPIMSRQMRAIPSMKLFSEELNDLDFAKKGRMIFEIMVLGMSKFSDLNGYLNRSTGDCEAHDAYLRVHDLVSIDKQTRFRYRHELACEVVKPMDHCRVKTASLLGYALQHSQWQELAEDVWSRQGEGIIMKRMSAGYSPGKRNADILKIKEEVTLDLFVTGIVEGTGKYDGTLGALEVEDKHGTCHLVSGMTDDERHMWWRNPACILNRVVEVKAMKKLEGGALREPRFKAIRHDKLRSEID